MSYSDSSIRVKYSLLYTSVADSIVRYSRISLGVMCIKNKRRSGVRPYPSLPFHSTDRLRLPVVGCFCFQTNQTALVLEGCMFDTCYGGKEGGGLLHEFGRLSIVDSLFYNNTAGSGNEEGGEGGRSMAHAPSRPIILPMKTSLHGQGYSPSPPPS